MKLEDHLNIATKEFLLDCSLKIARVSALSGEESLSIITRVLQSGIVEARNQYAISIQQLKECEDVLNFYTHSWDSGEEAINYFKAKQ
jgi:hypothetical protein